MPRERAELLVNNVLPSWLKRAADPQCAQLWKQVVGPATGIELL